jgi:hypothetical protein
MGVTSGTGTPYSSGTHELTPIFRGVRVAQSSDFCIVFL